MSTANPNRTRTGIQCRTMLSQRPCGHPGCERPECSRARLSAEVFATALDAPVSAPETAGVQEPSRVPVSLSERELRLLADALASHRLRAPVGMDYREVDTLRAKIVDAWIMS